MSQGTVLTDRFDRALADRFRQKLPGQLADELHEIVEALEAGK